jgi:hypothetical protein
MAGIHERAMGGGPVVVWLSLKSEGCGNQWREARQGQRVEQEHSRLELGFYQVSAGEPWVVGERGGPG